MVRAAIHTRHYFPLQDRLAEGYDAGDEVLAIGHPRGLHFTSTRGIVSEASRTMPDGSFVQTDVAINPGNSGGPLLDGQGNLVGINTWIRTDSQGLGFAIPGAEILDYFLEFSRLHRTGHVEIPTDEQLADLAQSLSPSELFEAAAELAELPVQRNEDIAVDQLWWNVTTSSGNGFHATADEILFITCHIADLTPAQQKDEELLFQLLRWQNEMLLCRFRIDEDSSLFVGYARPFEDLDVSEACSALLAMSSAVDSYLPALKDYLGTP